MMDLIRFQVQRRIPSGSVLMDLKMLSRWSYLYTNDQDILMLF